MYIIYEPKGMAKEYADLAANLFSGCGHGCTYCFGPSVLRKSKEDFHENPSIKEEALQRLEKDAAKLFGDPRKILLSFVTDPYQSPTVEQGITREAIKILMANQLHFTILTKGGMRAARDFDLLSDYPRASFGTTLVFSQQADTDTWEPNVPSIEDRKNAIRVAHEKGIRTWVSLEPVIDPEQALGLIRELHLVVDHWKVGKLNHRKLPVGWKRFRKNVTDLFETLGADYYLKKSLTSL